MNNNNKIITFVSILLILSVTYIAYDFGKEYLQQERENYYNLGREVGILEWSEEVRTTIIKEGNIPYWVFNNNTKEVFKETESLINLCGSSK